MIRETKTHTITVEPSNTSAGIRLSDLRELVEKTQHLSGDLIMSAKIPNGNGAYSITSLEMKVVA